jgi:bacillithiol biosynthesis deacetylase BshB1
MRETEYKVDVLAVGAHPDDVELGCGATLVALAARGRSFGILDLTRGESGTRGTPEIRAAEAAAAARTLGARFRESLDLGDGGLRTDREAEMQVIEVIRRARPKLVIAPFPADRHPDHVRASRLATEASFYAGLRALKNGAEAHRPQTVVYYASSYTQQPSFFVDVTETFETKMKAIRCFASQFYDPASTEPETVLTQATFLDAIEARARAHGKLINATFAEAFVSSRPPTLADPVSAFAGYEPGFDGSIR